MRMTGACGSLAARSGVRHSLPGALKNAIDWVIGSGELYRKVVGITAAVAHASRGLRGLEALAQILGAVDATLVWDAPLVHGHGPFGAGLGAVLRALVDEVGRQRPAGAARARPAPTLTR